MGKAYVDGAYIKSVHGIHGRHKMKTFPNMTYARFLYWTIFKKISKIRPFWYLKYSKEEAREFLQKTYDWTYYGGHHLENRMTAFHHSYYTPVKFGLDQRNNTLAARVRAGLLNRETALAEYATPPILEQGIVDYTMKRLGFTKNEFHDIMNRPKKFYTDYQTYKRRFERMRPIFRFLAKRNLVPMSFYLKYCFPAKNPV